METRGGTSCQVLVFHKVLTSKQSVCPQKNREEKQGSSRRSHRSKAGSEQEVDSLVLQAGEGFRCHLRISRL